MNSKIKISFRSIFTKIFIISMTFLAAVPCVVKKDFKQALNIAVSDLEERVKPNKAVVCPSFYKTAINSNSVGSQKQELQKPDYNFGAVKYPSEVSHLNFYPFANSLITVSVPIYILHEQYLI